jgi:type I restriction enzyme S subunit
VSRTVARLEALAAPKPYALVGGPFGSKLTSVDYVEEGIPVIRGSNLNGGRYLDEDEFVYVSEQKVRDDLFGNLANHGDIVFTQRGTLGQVAIIPQDSRFETYVISQSQMKLSVDPQKADARFIYYYFSSPEAVQKIINRNSSSGVPHINLTVLRNFLVPVPALREQQRIAEILSAYDDLIENNRRRIVLLEEAARMLYREWFVRFRFPGHEHVKLIDGFPEGWERRALGSVVNLQRGFDLPVQDRVAAGIPVYGSTGVVGEHDTAKVSVPTLITGRSGSLGTVCFVDGPCWPLNTSLWVTEFKAVSVYFAYFMLIEINLAKFGGGASVPTLDRKVVHAINVLVPPKLLGTLFDEQVCVLFAQKKVLDEQNKKLVQARDLLLPRLMNGEIAV